jgi:hypothetical protein
MVFFLCLFFASLHIITIEMRKNQPVRRRESGQIRGTLTGEKGPGNGKTVAFPSPVGYLK